MFNLRAHRECNDDLLGRCLDDAAIHSDTASSDAGLPKKETASNPKVEPPTVKRVRTRRAALDIDCSDAEPNERETSDDNEAYGHEGFVEDCSHVALLQTPRVMLVGSPKRLRLHGSENLALLTKRSPRGKGLSET